MEDLFIEVRITWYGSSPADQMIKDGGMRLADMLYCESGFFGTYSMSANVAISGTLLANVRPGHHNQLRMLPVAFCLGTIMIVR